MVFGGLLPLFEPPPKLSGKGGGEGTKALLRRSGIDGLGKRGGAAIGAGGKGATTTGFGSTIGLGKGGSVGGT
jgi:hypothetical protein